MEYRLGMGRTYDEITEATAAWIERQQMFFIATAPANGGHVNLSPKGLGALRIEGPNRVSYLDLTGSGAETIAHLRDNGRVTIMFCAFEGPPRIVRLYGTGSYVAATDDAFAEAIEAFDEQHGSRAVITVDVERVADSCGYGVPRYTYVEQRKRLAEWSEQRDDEALIQYWAEKNSESIDGLPALQGSPRGQST